MEGDICIGMGLLRRVGFGRTVEIMSLLLLVREGIEVRSCRFWEVDRGGKEGRGRGEGMGRRDGFEGMVELCEGWFGEVLVVPRP